MFERLLTVKYITSKTSFCCVSFNNWKALQGNSIKVVYNETQEVFFSIDVSSAFRSDEYFGINSLYAKSLGIPENSIVTVSEIAKPPTIQSVSIVANSKDDHNILEMLAETVQSTLLHQIRILSNNQRFIIWIGNSIHVTVNVCDIKPISPGRIDNLTEVIIIPPGDPVNNKKISQTQTNLDIFSKYAEHQKELILRTVLYNELNIDNDLALPFNAFVLKCSLNSDTNTFLNPQIFSIKLIKPNDENKSEEVYVRVYALEDIGVNTSELFCTENIFVSKSLIEHFNCDIGARVLLKIFKKELPTVSEIQIFSKQNYSSKIDDLFRTYLDENTKRQSLILNKDLIFCIGNDNLRILLKFEPVESTFCNVDNSFSANCKISFTKDNIEIKEYSFAKKNIVLDKYTMNVLNYQEIIDSCLFLLMQNFKTKGLHCNNVLITGKTGTGKTSLLKIVDIKLTQYPNFIYTKNINCKSIKGKTLESLHKIFLSIFCDLIHHQPSVLILDDLHVLCEHANEGDVLAPNALYFNRISEMLENLFQHFCNGNAIGILASSISTTKLNKHIYATRGNHLFKNVLTIKDFTKNDRKQALEFLFSPYELKAIDFNTLSEKTESFIMQDLVDFCNKALFESYQDDPNQTLIAIKPEHCQNALDTLTVSSLDGVKLQTPGTKDFSDIGGLENVKSLLVETMLWPSKHPNLFENSPLRLPSGLLLYGSPGTGKTILAGAAARHCGLRLISIKGPELLSKYIGASEQAVRDVFQRAQSVKPCVLFFDEFDSLAPRRGHDNTGVTDRVVNQLLTQLDGVESLSGVFVLAATSRPDLLDPALLRPGRLDRHIRCPLPNKEARQDILKALGKSLNFASDVNLSEIAECCDGFSGADLQAVLYSAQLDSVRGLLDDELVDEEKEEEVQEDILREISKDQLMEAVRKTRPSLSQTERSKYERIYRKFEQGSEEFVPGSRATLA